MLIVLSPAKSLDFSQPSGTTDYSIPPFLSETEKLVKKLKLFSPEQLVKLMGVSPELGKLNAERYQNWHLPFTPENAKQAVFAFSGEVYTGLQASTLSEKSLNHARKKLRILSGLYGLLQPLDLIQPYRLEMGTRLQMGRNINLYHYWGNKITDAVIEATENSGSKVLVNLASAEYFKSIRTDRLKLPVITPVFKEHKNGSYKIVTVYAKRARGLMTRFILDNNIDNPDDIQAFDVDGYHFNPRMSKLEAPVFTRG